MITKYISNLKRAPVRQVLELQGSVLTPVPMQSRGPLRTAHCKRKRSHPPAYSCIKSPLKSVVKPNSQEGSAGSLQSCPQKAELKHQPRARQGAWARRSPGLGDLKQLIPPHIPNFSSPATPHLCQHNCLYCRMVNQTKQLKVPDL